MYFKKEKIIIASVICTVLILGLYSLYVYARYIVVNPEIINDFSFWGKTFLILIPVMIVAQIIIYIVFAAINKILNHEDIPTITDEMDRLIELKSIRISHWTFSVGFLLAMGSQALGMQPWVMFVTLFGSCFISGIASEIAKIYFYRKGV